MKIAAVFATMNRRDTAVACVQALAAQSAPPDLVVVADNVSRDGTAEALEALEPLPFSLVVHRMEDNRGNAGGIEEAMTVAFGNGSDAIWILDDDSHPRTDALQHLLGAYRSGNQVIHSLQIDPATGDLTWPMQILDPQRGWHTISHLKELPLSGTVQTRNNWTGSLLPRSVWQMVGHVMGELFIRGEDEEYPWRFLQHGITQACVCESILDHPGPAALVSASFFGKRIYFEPGLADWKLYYKVRNMVWLQRRKRGLLPMLGMAAAYLWAILRNDEWGKVAVFFQATRDGVSGRLGRWRKHPC